MEKQRGDQSHQEKENSEDSDNPAAGYLVLQRETSYGKTPLPKTVMLGSNPHLAHGASSSVDKESQKETEATWNDYLKISPHTSNYIEAVISMVRKIYGRQPGDPMTYLNVNLAMW